MESEKPKLLVRSPQIGDAQSIWQLVRSTGVLDLNSAYLYLLLCRDFAETCLVAESESRLVGFVTAYRPPADSQTLFVWQVGVCDSVRRQGVAFQLLNELISRSDPSKLHFLEATVSPSNRPSRRLFESVARTWQVPLTDVEGAGFSELDFPPGDHEPEPRLRIGPFHKRSGSIHPVARCGDHSETNRN